VWPWRCCLALSMKCLPLEPDPLTLFLPSAFNRLSNFVLSGHIRAVPGLAMLKEAAATHTLPAPWSLLSRVSL